MGALLDWYNDWLKQQKKFVKMMETAFDPLAYKEIVEILRDQARDCENSERDPKTGESTWLKETTVEWQAADLLEEYKAEIDKYEEMINDLIELSYAQRMVLGLDDNLKKE